MAHDRRRHVVDTALSRVPNLGNMREAEARLYAEGVADGIEMVLRLVVGEGVHEAAPYPGPYPPELIVWAQRGLNHV